MTSIDPKHSLFHAWQNEFHILLKQSQFINLTKSEQSLIESVLTNTKSKPEEQFVNCWSIIATRIFIRYPFEFKDAFLRFKKSSKELLQAAQIPQHSAQRLTFIKAHAYSIREEIIAQAINARIINFLHKLNKTHIQLEKSLSDQFVKFLLNTSELEILISYYKENHEEPVHSFYTIVDDPLFIPDNLIKNEQENVLDGKRNLDKYLEKIERPYSLLFIDLLEGSMDDRIEKIIEIKKIEIEISYNVANNELITKEGVNAILKFNESNGVFE